MYDKILFGYATFIDCCARGELDAYDIDDFIDAWHSSTSPRKLSECIGLPFDEFQRLGDKDVNLYKELLEKIIKVKIYYR